MANTQKQPEPPKEDRVLVIGDPPQLIRYRRDYKCSGSVARCRGCDLIMADTRGRHGPRCPIDEQEKQRSLM